MDVTIPRLHPDRIDEAAQPWPSFPAPIYASLIEGEDGASNLIWSR